ncbi:MAG: Crp/Fnr family transcriptional regulator [Brachymonas sp.]|nr:Crp/Fnr family transcriptional regulator [Brachymonas sp.]
MFALDNSIHFSLMLNPWFASLEPQQRTRLVQVCERKVVKAGQAVMEQDTRLRKRMDGLYVLVAGEINICVTTLTGSEAILSVIKPGQWFGELALVDRLKRECEARAVSECVLGVIDSEAFSLLMQDAAFAARLSELLASRTRLWVSLLEDFLLRSARARTARRLLLLSRHDDLRAEHSFKEVSVSQSALASMLGMTRQTLAQQLRVLADLGAITQGYGRIEIASPVALMAEATAG